MRAHALLAGAHQECRHQPFVERDMRAFKEGADRDGKLFAARVALIPAGTGAEGRSFAEGAAMTADRAGWPKLGFKPLARLGLVLKGLVVEFVRLGHWPLPSALNGIWGMRAAEPRL